MNLFLLDYKIVYQPIQGKANGFQTKLQTEGFDLSLMDSYSVTPAAVHNPILLNIIHREKSQHKRSFQKQENARTVTSALLKVTDSLHVMVYC